jgi:hypothetical protein
MGMRHAREQPFYIAFIGLQLGNRDRKEADDAVRSECRVAYHVGKLGKLFIT